MTERNGPIGFDTRNSALSGGKLTEMPTENVQLKLKQASAVLKIPPKELQNFVQFGVLRPARQRGLSIFDVKALLAAEVAICLKSAIAPQASRLSTYVEAFSNRVSDFLVQQPEYVIFRTRPTEVSCPMEIKIPFREMVAKLAQQLKKVSLYSDLPRGRKRPGWREEFLRLLAEAAEDMGDVSQDDILQTIREYRKEKREPEITVVAEGQKA